MKIKKVVISALAYITFTGCEGNYRPNHEHLNTDSILIFNKVINYPEIRAILEDKNRDTIYIVKNRVFYNQFNLDFPKNKFIKLINLENESGSYPRINYKYRLEVSFEALKIKKNMARCDIYLKSSELLSSFNLVKKDSEWTIVKYSYHRF